MHCDVRSDNLCLRDQRAVLLDWNHARIGNPAFDVAFWLPSLTLEGGPDPATFGVDELAVFVAGFFAATGRTARTRGRAAGAPLPAAAARGGAAVGLRDVVAPATVERRRACAVYDRLTIRTRTLAA